MVSGKQDKHHIDHHIDYKCLLAQYMYYSIVPPQVSRSLSGKAHLEQINVFYVMISHQLTDGSDRTYTVLAISKEEVWHHVPLQADLLLHVAG